MLDLLKGERHDISDHHLHPQWPLPILLEALPVMSNDLMDDPSLLGWHAWCVVQKDHNIIIGDVGFKGPPDINGAIKIGYSIIPAYRNQGLAKEAVKAMIETVSKDPSVRKITAEVLALNIPSIKLLGSQNWEHVSDNEEMEVWEYTLGDRMERCSWCIGNEIYEKYHDEEWGFPVHDDRKHFEFLILESAQAGLSWLTILKRREGYRKAFANYDPKTVSTYDKNRIEELVKDASIIRNRMKVEAAVNNARRFLEIQNEFGTFDNYIWSFTNSKQIVNKWKSIEDIPPRTSLSDQISKDLKKRGFKFVGSTIIYAHLQAVGIVNDHIATCFRYGEVLEK